MWVWCVAGNDAYNSDYPGADGLQAEDPSSLNEWAQYADDNGTPYWYADTLL